MTDLPVYDVVLLPPSPVSGRAVEVSAGLARHGTDFTLEEQVRHPHLSLYMANFRPDDLPEVRSRLAELAERIGELPLKATRYGHNFDEGMFEVFYDRTDAVAGLQQEVIAALNPLRFGLRHRDPVGRLVADRLLSAPAPARGALAACGYDEVGELFHPHITFTRFTRRGTETDLSALPPLPEFDATYRTLGLFTMGEHGTCLTEDGRWELASRAGQQPFSEPVGG